MIKIYVHDDHIEFVIDGLQLATNLSGVCENDPDIKKLLKVKRTETNKKKFCSKIRKMFKLVIDDQCVDFLDDDDDNGQKGVRYAINQKN